jgi:hypothetical protein
MTWDHDRVEELLAGQALGGLDLEDAELAERALLEHVPGCERCRAALEDFRMLAGDLALEAPPARPPDTLRARLRREVANAPGGRPQRWVGWTAMAAGLVLVGSLSGWNLMLNSRLSDTESQQTALVDAVSTLGHPEGGVVPLEGPLQGRLSLLYVPDDHKMYLVASGLRRPSEGVYRVWLEADDRTVAAASFVPKKGAVMLPVERSLEGVRRVIITHERSSTDPMPKASPLAEALLQTG